MVTTPEPPQVYEWLLAYAGSSVQRLLQAASVAAVKLSVALPQKHNPSSCTAPSHTAATVTHLQLPACYAHLTVTTHIRITRFTYLPATLTSQWLHTSESHDSPTYLLRSPHSDYTHQYHTIHLPTCYTHLTVTTHISITRFTYLPATLTSQWLHTSVSHDSPTYLLRSPHSDYTHQYHTIHLPTCYAHLTVTTHIRITRFTYLPATLTSQWLHTSESHDSPTCLLRSPHSDYTH